jgi:hypothetical protein
MAEEKLDAREMTWRNLLPWTVLFQGFQVALDLNKLLLAAAGIFVMWGGWALLSLIFAAHLDSKPPAWPGSYLKEDEADADRAWGHFKSDRDHWNLLYETANVRTDHNHRYEVEDLASTLAEYSLVKKALTDEETGVAAPPREVPDRIDHLVRENKLSEEKGRLYTSRLGKLKPAARLATSPWQENRGPNPYLLITGQAGVPWESGHFWDWLLRDQLLVMIEPLVKLVLPVIYFFNARSDFVSSLYFLLVLLWALATWAVFGGAITRIAAVQVARSGEKLGLGEALRFTVKRILSYLMAPLCPLIGVFLILVVMIVFGVLHMILPAFSDIFIDGLFWPLMVLLGLAMAVLLVGLVGWPLMSCTISAEGTDSWEAVTRAYSYVYQKPWHYLWYSLVAIAYGAVLVFFVGLMGSLMVYLAKWGIQQTPFIVKANREPSFLFVHAPDSFGWRTLLLEGATFDGQKIVENGQINQGLYDKYVGNTSSDSKDRMSWWNHVGAFMVAFWLGLIFLLVVGFGYSYFWSASTIIYLLMRRNLDAAELDEVYLEEDEHDGGFGTGIPPAPLAPSAAKPVVAGPTMLEPPTLKAPSASAPITTPPPREKPPEPPLTQPPATERPLPEPPAPPAAEKPVVPEPPAVSAKPTMIEPSAPPPTPEPPHPPEGETPPHGPDAPL